jgi:hypothetical protein
LGKTQGGDWDIARPADRDEHPGSGGWCYRPMNVVHFAQVTPGFRDETSGPLVAPPTPGLSTRPVPGHRNPWIDMRLSRSFRARPGFPRRSQWADWSFPRRSQRPWSRPVPRRSQRLSWLNADPKRTQVTSARPNSSRLCEAPRRSQTRITEVGKNEANQATPGNGRQGGG